MSKKKGIVDPWRTVEPLRPPVPPSLPVRERINIEDVDRDADLAIPNKHVIRSEHACFDVTSTRIDTQTDALDLLAECIGVLFLDRQVKPLLVDAGIGVRCLRQAWNEPGPDVAASTLRGGDGVVWFIDQPLDHGMRALARVLRTSAAAPIVRRYGIVVMLTSR
jgi:hypothetical protein